MYKEYWKLNSDPFSNTPEPMFYFAPKDGRDSVSDILSGIAKQKALIVLSGQDGTGKTTSLRRVVDLLDPQCHKVAFVTNPAKTFPPLLREIVGQLQNRACGRQTLEHYARSFAASVSAISRDRRRAVVIIDNFASTSVIDLASLHSLLTQDVSSRNVSFVIAGPPALKSSFQEQTCRALFADISFQCETSELRSRQSMQSYIAHRLRAAGRIDTSPFSTEALDAIWLHPANRLQRNLNSVCRACLKRAAERSADNIDETLARTVCETLHAASLSGVREVDFSRTSQAQSSPNSRRPLQPPRDSRDAAKSRLASQLATDRIKHLDRVVDPFEAWNSAREEILSALHGSRLHRVAE